MIKFNTKLIKTNFKDPGSIPSRGKTFFPLECIQIEI